MDKTKSIVFHAGGFGDLFVCFKALYALKELYPQHKLILYTHGISQDFLSKIAFIDEVINFTEVSLEKIRALNPDIFISTMRSADFFDKLLKLNFKKVIVQPHSKSFFSSYFSTPFPYFRARLHMSEIVLKLVRTLNPRHYDTHISKLDFSRVKDFLPSNSSLSKDLLLGGGGI